MQKRTSHNKSRRGCLNCKKRHVKCDEQGPPCANCVVRKSDCVYPSFTETRAKTNARKRRTTTTNVSTLTRRSKKESPAYSSGNGSISRSQSRSPPSFSSQSRSSPSSDSSLFYPSSFESPFQFYPSSSAVTFSSTMESDRLLEMELMHRWSTRTYTGLYSMPADTPYFQTTIPHAALRRSYVMNSILAAAAVDLAVSAVEGPQAEKYYYMALKYGTQASAGFRTELENINEENLHILYHISALLAVWNYTMAGRHGSTLDRMHVIFDMFFGAATIAWTNPKWLTSVPSSSRDAIYLKPLTMDVVDANTLTALGYLATVSRQIHVRPIRTPIAMFNLEFETEGPLLASEAYRIPIAQLRYSFAEDAVDRIKGYVMSLITVGGPEFVAAVKAHEPMALFMLMYFGVLVNRSSSQETRWWLGTAGRDIVSEISDILENSPIARIPEGRLGMSWTREQVGLPPLADVGLGQSFCSLTEIESLFLT